MVKQKLTVGHIKCDDKIKVNRASWSVANDLIIFDKIFKRNHMKIYQFKITFILLVASLILTSCQSGQNNGSDESEKKAKPKVEQVSNDQQSAEAIKIASLQDLFDNRDQYGGKQVEVSGKCVKVNNQIMGRNWVHIQDGTKDGETAFDLTITTQEEVDVDNDLTFEGVITLNKDFGGGYTYEVIMEKAKLK